MDFVLEYKQLLLMCYCVSLGQEPLQREFDCLEVVLYLSIF